MVAYGVVKENPEGLIQQLDHHSKEHEQSPEQYFTSVRALRDTQERYKEIIGDSVQAAARLIYLNKTCFNGLYRVRKTDGRFNTPWGKRETFNFCAEGIQAASRALACAEVKFRDFAKAYPESNDFVFCDPPYDGTYNQYTKIGFGDKQQIELAQLVRKWASSGTKVMVTNSDTPQIRNLYKDFQIEVAPTLRSVNCNGSCRGAVDDLLITTYKTPQRV